MHEIFTNTCDLKKTKNNLVIFEDGSGDTLKMSNSKVIFNEGSRNNILFIEKGVKLVNSSIVFNASNSIIYLSSNRFNYHISVSIYNNSTFFIGKDCFFNTVPEIFKCILSEQKNVIIGNNCFFSFDIWIRLADPHLIYDLTTRKRLNHSKSVYIGDGVWIGQHASLFKGTQIGSGSIIGAMSVVSKKIPSHCVAAGIPAKIIKENIFWSDQCVHGWTDVETEKCEYSNSNFRVYDPKTNTDFFSFIESNLTNIRNNQERLNFIKENLAKIYDQNRFAFKI